jgi:hypothetical protein
MSNHDHLLLEIPEANLVGGMKWVQAWLRVESWELRSWESSGVGSRVALRVEWR